MPYRPIQMREYFENSLLFGKKKNALFSWFLSIYLLITSFNIFLDGNLIWSIYTVSIVLLVFLPVMRSQRLTDMVPFEVLFLLAVPFTLKGIEFGLIGAHTLNYISASVIALLIIVELDTFTSFKTTNWFSVYLVMLTTVAIAGLWAVIRWISDIYLGTNFIVSENLLMWEFVAAAIAGLVAGKLFGFYFRERDRRLIKYED